MHEVLGTILGRWYVTAFGVTYLILAGRQLGIRKALGFLGIATLVGALAENGSVRYGIPYTRYAFKGSLRGDELFLGDVPLMVPLSYCFNAYFAFAAGRMLASGPFRTRAPKHWHELLMAWVLALWATWLLDPMSRLGSHFFLGDLFSYAGPGFWFGLPTGSQVGYGLTTGLMILVLARLDRHAPDRPVRRLRQHPDLLALIGYHAEILQMMAAGFWIARYRHVPAGNTLAGAAVLLWVPIAAMTAIHWSHLRMAQERPAVGRTDAATQPVTEGPQPDIVLLVPTSATSTELRTAREATTGGMADGVGSSGRQR